MALDADRPIPPMDTGGYHVNVNIINYGDTLNPQFSLGGGILDTGDVIEIVQDSFNLAALSCGQIHGT
jgi:hypothetical protein